MSHLCNFTRQIAISFFIPKRHAGPGSLVPPKGVRFGQNFQQGVDVWERAGRRPSG